jgi:hypothetical protein
LAGEIGDSSIIGDVRVNPTATIETATPAQEKGQPQMRLARKSKPVKFMNNEPSRKFNGRDLSRCAHGLSFERNSIIFPRLVITD